MVEFGERAVLVVDEVAAGARKVGRDHDLRIAVAVHVDKARREAVEVCGQFRPPAAAVTSVKVSSPLFSNRRFCQVDKAGQGLPAAHEQIEIAVEVVVSERRAGGGQVVGEVVWLTPAARAMSVNVPLPLLRYSRC